MPSLPALSLAAGPTRLRSAKVLAAGLSNCTLAQLKAFHTVCPISAVQPPYSMLQRQIEDDVVPWCREHHVALVVYWPLARGLLAGKLRREDELTADDRRRHYPMFRGDEWRKNHDLVDRLRDVAADAGRSLAQVAINWTVHRPGITCALCGASAPDQLRENAAAAGWQLTARQREWIRAALDERGTPVVRAAVQ